MNNTIQLSNSHQYNHGCRNYAEATDNGDGTATVTQVQSCNSCWQVGHDRDYTYLTPGETIRLADYDTHVVTE